jgi:hypothetical protein
MFKTLEISGFFSSFHFSKTKARAREGKLMRVS